MKIASAVAAALVGLMSGIALSGDPASKFKVTTKKADDAVAVQVEKDRTNFSVKSPSGISQAVIERVADKWPESVALRLHLTGLESFRVSNGKIALDAAVSTQDGKVRIWKDGKENSLLDAKSPFWLAVHMLDGDGKPAKEIPLKNGCFEITLPKAFFEGNPKSITVNWVDFYRG